MRVQALTEDEDAHRLLSNPKWLRKVARDPRRQRLNMSHDMGRVGGVTCECSYGVRHRDGGSLCLMLMVTKEHPRQGMNIAGSSGSCDLFHEPSYCISPSPEAVACSRVKAAVPGERGREWI